MKDIFAGFGILGAIVIAFIALIALGLGLFVLNQEVLRFKAPIIGETERIETVNSGEFRIRAYNQFFDICESVQNAEGRIDIADDVLQNADPSDRFYSTYVLNLAGAKQSRVNAVNDYNSNSRKDWTEAIFKDSDLPWGISIDYEPHGRKTICATS